MLKLTAIALEVNPSAMKTEVFPTNTYNVITTTLFFHPTFAERTLLMVNSFQILFESHGIFLTPFVIFTSHAFVQRIHAFQAIDVTALITLVGIYSLIFFVNECCSAVRCRTSQQIWLLFHILVNLILLINLFEFLSKQISQIFLSHLLFAIHVGTQYRVNMLFYLILNVII